LVTGSKKRSEPPVHGPPMDAVEGMYLCSGVPSRRAMQAATARAGCGCCFAVTVAVHRTGRSVRRALTDDAMITMNSFSLDISSIRPPLDLTHARGMLTSRPGTSVTKHSLLAAASRLIHRDLCAPLGATSRKRVGIRDSRTRTRREDRVPGARTYGVFVVR